MCCVSLVEDEVNHLQRRIEPALESFSAWHLERQAALPDLTLGPHQPLRDRCVVSQKRARDLAHAEAADRFEAQRQARVPGDLRMAAHENHPQLVVAKLLLEIRISGVNRLAELGDRRIGLLDNHALPPNRVDRGIVRDAEEPARRVLRRPLIGPRLESPQHGLLHAILGQVEAGRAEQPRQPRGDPAGLAPEQVIEQRSGLGRRGHVW